MTNPYEEWAEKSIEKWEQRANLFCPHCNNEIKENDETCHEMNEGKHYHLKCWHETGRVAWKVVDGIVYTVQGGQIYPMPTATA